MSASQAQAFSLLGGPLHRLGRRLGLVRDQNTIALGVAIGLLMWAVLFCIVLSGDLGGKLFSLPMIGVHVRLLVAIPLIFIGETVLDPRMTEFSRILLRWRLVPEVQAVRLNDEITRARRWSDSWLPEALCVVAAVLMSVEASRLQMAGTTAVFDPDHAASRFALVAWWYWAVCLTLFRFLVFRCVWRFCQWCWFLWRVSRLELCLVPTHPDRVGGLGYLEVVQSHWVPLILAISAVQSAKFAEGVAAGTMAFSAIYPQVTILLVLDAVLFLGPLCVFTSRLWAARVSGLSTYMGFAERYARQFDHKWLGASAPPEAQMGTPDMSTLADLFTVVDNVRGMRWVPGSVRLLMLFAAAALLPLLPLLLLKYPVAELAGRLVENLTGL